MEDGFDYQTAIEEFQDERPVWKQIWAAIITEFTPDKKNWFGAAFSFVLALILTIIIAPPLQNANISLACILVFLPMLENSRTPCLFVHFTKGRVSVFDVQKTII